MDKTEALRLLGGSIKDAAEAVGVSYQAVRQWPDPLPPAIADRVQAAIARRLLTPEQLGMPPAKSLAASEVTHPAASDRRRLSMHVVPGGRRETDPGREHKPEQRDIDTILRPCARGDKPDNRKERD
jgi:hypothetical protein